MQVFISYARADGAGLASHLESDLRHRGYDAWRDQSQIQGGASWTDRIEAGIDGCSALLAVLTPASYRSPMCRAEQLRALRKGKRVVPVLAQQNADRPLHLEHLDYRDFTGKYSDAIGALVQDLSGSKVVPIPDALRQTYVTAPPLPPYVIQRSDEMKRVRDALLAEETGRTVGVTAVRGLGGIGKTVLANLVAHDPVLEDAFPDGIAWVEIGKNPGDLASQLQEVGRVVEGDGFKLENYNTREAGRNRLRTVLRSKAALLILDDVWDSAHLEPFLLDAPRCRTLFTTREGRIASSSTVGATEVCLGTLSREQSIGLLKDWAGRDDPALGQVAEVLGDLPLALRLAGARLREGMKGAEWLEQFGRHVSRIRDGLRATKRDENLEACFLTSLEGFEEGHQRLFDALGVFPEDVAIPLAQAARLWRALDPALTDFDCSELARELDRSSLLQLTPEKSLTLHDLVHEFARERLKDQVPRLNRIFLAAHNPAGRPWHEIPDDGYLRQRLAWHLKEAGRMQELEQLLGTYQWLEAKLGRGLVSELFSDYDLLDPKHELRHVQAALRLSAHVLSVRPAELASQLQGRLVDVKNERVRDLCHRAHDGRKTIWLRPLRASLVKPGGSLLLTIGDSCGAHAVAVTPDGERAVSASISFMVVWDLESGEVLCMLEGHSDWVNAVAVTPDGKRAVSASKDNTLKVWDLGSGAELRALEGHGWMNAVAVTPDGERAVSASVDRTLKVWDLESGAESPALERHRGKVNAVAVTTNGKRAVSASGDGTLKVWDLESGAELRALEGHGGVSAVAVTADGKRAVSASDDCTLKVWDLESGAELRALEGHRDSVRAVAVTPDGKRAVSASDDCTLKVWDLESGDELWRSDHVDAVAVTADGKRAVSASDDCRLKMWDLETGAELCSFTADAALMCVGVTTSQVVAGDDMGGVHLLAMEEATTGARQ